MPVTLEEEVLQRRVEELERKLCWLRNHYAVGHRSVRKWVLKDVDECLAKNPRYILPPQYPDYEE